MIFSSAIHLPLGPSQLCHAGYAGKKGTACFLPELFPRFVCVMSNLEG